MSTEIVGLDRLMRKLDKMGGNVLVALEKSVKDTTLAAQASAKRYVPVDTGNLKSNILVSFEKNPDKVTGIVADNVEYAIHQELGTYRMAAQPYMMPALNENKDTFERTAIAHVQDAITKLGG